MTPADVALLAWSAVVSVVSLVAVRRSLRRHPPAATSQPPRSLTSPLLLVRPCAGAEPSLATTLGSLGALASHPMLRVRYAVATINDPATPFVAAACAHLTARGVDAQVVVTAATAPNQKSEHLAHVIAHEPDAPVIVNADSDVDLTAFDWDALLSPLADPSLAAVWAPPFEATGTTLGDRASEALLGGSLHAFVLLAGIDDGGMVGKVVALRRAALESVGGFSALREHLGEDAELGRRLLAAGTRIRASAGVAVSRASGRTLAAAVARYGRWLTVIRAQRPALLLSYPALLFATPLLVLGASLVAITGLGGRASLLAAGLAVLARLAVAWAAARASGRPPRPLTDAALADALLAAAWVRALTTRTVQWRGRILRIERGGTLRAVAGLSPPDT